MTRRPTDDELRTLLRELPRPDPPPGFAEGVLARVRAFERRRLARPWLLAVAASLVFGAALVLRALAPAPVAAPDPERVEFEEILAEHRRLAEEIDAMRRLAGEPPLRPLLRIGGSEELDLFLDLQPWLDSPAPPAGVDPGGPAVVPAADRRPW